MANELEKIQTPAGTYDIQDAGARTLISGLDDAKFNKSNIDTSIANPSSDTKVLSEKAVVDNYFNKSNIDTSMANPTSDSKVLSEKAVKDYVDNGLAPKANKDGNYPTMTVGMADNLTPYDESAGDDQDEPFSFQATGTANGSQADFATGSNALMREKQGNTVVVNQLAKPLVSGNWSDFLYSSTITFNDGVITATTNNENKRVGFGQTADIKANHKYLAIINITNASDGLDLYFGLKNVGFLISKGLNYKIADRNSDTNEFGVYTETLNIDGAYISCDYIKLIDLTQWFGSNDNIPADLLAHPENFFRYYQGSLAYNAGQIVNANSRYIKCIGRQQWDEEVEVTGSPSHLESKNYIRVIPNAKYHLYRGGSAAAINIYCYDNANNFIEDLGNKANESYFTIPSNCIYIKLVFNAAYGTSYRNDTTLSLYYEGESGYDQYYPYEILTNNDTGTEELKSAGNVADSKTPDGTITRRVGAIVINAENITSITPSGGGSGILYANTNLQVNDVNASIPLGNRNGISSNGLAVRRVSGYWIDHNTIGILSNENIVISKDDISTLEEFKALCPITAYYYKTPTTESGTPFSENLVIDDFGSMDFSGTSEVPQGNLIFYSVDYKAFVDTLYDYTEGTPSDIQLKSDLSTAITTFLTGLTGYDATKTQVLKNVEGTLTWVDEEA